MIFPVHTMILSHLAGGGGRGSWCKRKNRTDQGWGGGGVVKQVIWYFSS